MLYIRASHPDIVDIYGQKSFTDGDGLSHCYMDGRYKHHKLSPSEKHTAPKLSPPTLTKILIEHYFQNAAIRSSLVRDCSLGDFLPGIADTGGEVILALDVRTAAASRGRDATLSFRNRAVSPFGANTPAGMNRREAERTTSGRNTFATLLCCCATELCSADAVPTHSIHEYLARLLAAKVMTRLRDRS